MQNFPRLCSVFGVRRLPDLDAAAIDLAISRNEVEDFDLDWKARHYPKDKNFELAKDIAAFANTAGGIIVIGVKETDGRAVQPMPVKFAGEAERIVQVLAGKIQPFLAGVEFSGDSHRDRCGLSGDRCTA